MPQSLACIYIHLIFSTKSRVPVLHDGVRDSLHRYLAVILKESRCQVTLINSVEDHVHILFQLGRTASISEVVEEVKKHSSRWLKPRDVVLAQFAWQAGYGAFSVSQKDLPSVVRYIADQEEHHRKATFQEEFLAILVEHNVEYDERYVWD